MHDEAKDFTLFMKEAFKAYFTNKIVLDVGSGDINGNNKFLFDSCYYVGNDVFQAPNVTIVCKTSALPFPDNHFDTIISTECFEHDPEFQDSLKNIIRMLKPGGLFTFTCASTGREEHGTRRTTPHDSFGTIGGLESFQDHYRNITVDDLDVSPFSQHAAYYNSQSKDLYFWGIKKYNVEFQYPFTTKTS